MCILLHLSIIKDHYYCISVRTKELPIVMCFVLIADLRKETLND